MGKDVILVTGAGGFIGQALVTELRERGVEFVGVMRRPAQNYVVVDLCDALAVRSLLASVRPDLIINLAAVGVHHDYRSAEEVVNVNVRLPVLLAERMPERCRLVHVGSMSEYLGGANVTEAAPRGSDTLYGRSKIAADDLLALIPRSIVRARVFGVIGVGERMSRLIPTIVNSWKSNQPILLSDGAQVRDVLHVSDVARALLSLVSSKVSGAVNVGSGEGHTVREIAERAARRLGIERLLRFGAMPRRLGEVDRIVANVSRLREFGFQPRLSFGQAVDLAVDELREP